MDEHKKSLRERAMQLPLDPGVYLMYDAAGKIIYIGKAKALKNRVSQYFGSERNHSDKVRKMVSLVERFDYIVTDSEFEALVLECSLIKQYTPKYNILLKDDKGYRYIKISAEEWPRISAAKQKQEDGAEYLGPYMSGYAVNQTVDEAQKVFGLPTCSRRFPAELGKGRPCLNYYIKQCSGVCRGKMSREEYNDLVREAVRFMKGGSGESVRLLTEQMTEAAENLEFEKAARLRDRIEAIRKLQDRQKVFAHDGEDQDVIAAVQGVKSVCFAVLRYSGGKLFGKEHHILSGYGENEMEEIREEFLERYYASQSRFPRKVLLDGPVTNRELVEQWLSRMAKRKVSILEPQKGDGKKLIELCRENAAEQLRWGQQRTAKELAALDELSRLLGLPKPPAYIEMYDISNLAGGENVAGMVVFENGRPLKSAYKKFKIKGFTGQDDYASMSEVLDRRLTEYEKSEEQEGFGRLPDLILLDGGKGQVSAVEPVLRAHGLKVPLFGLVKDDKHRTRAVSTAGSEISIRSVRSAYTLLSEMQEEVHRFAIGFHRQQRKKNTLQLSLSEIEGIGEKRAKALLSYFKTVKAIGEANVEVLAAVPGMNLPSARSVYHYFHENNGEGS